MAKENKQEPDIGVITVDQNDRRLQNPNPRATMNTNPNLNRANSNSQYRTPNSGARGGGRRGMLSCAFVFVIQLIVVNYVC